MEPFSIPLPLANLGGHIPYSRVDPVCAILPLYVETMLLLPMLGIFDMRTDVNAYDCTGRLYEHHNTKTTGVCTEG